MNRRNHCPPFSPWPSTGDIDLRVDFRPGDSWHGLISDAVHNLSNIAVMDLSYGAEKVARRPADESKTYVYRKVEFLAAFINCIVLSVEITFIFWEALKRPAAPPEIPGQIIFWVAVVAFVGNGTATLLRQKTSSGSLKLKSA